MVKIATPISTIFDSAPHLEELLGLSDALEVREHSKSVASNLPRIYHCDWSLIEPWEKEDLQEISKIIKSNKVELVTFHLKSCYINPPLRDNMFQPKGRKMLREEMLKNVNVNKQSLEKAIGTRVAVGVENNNFYPTGAYETVTDTEFINEIMSEFGIKLLLDVAHAQITAHNQKFTLENYLSKLNLEKVVQLHLSRPNQDQLVASDTHEALANKDWELVKTIMPRCPNLEYVTLEYYRDDKQLIGMLKKLKEIVQ